MKRFSAMLTLVAVLSLATSIGTNNLGLYIAKKMKANDYVSTGLQGVLGGAGGLAGGAAGAWAGAKIGGTLGSFAGPVGTIVGATAGAL